MDPLSIIASTIAIVGVVASSSKAIQHIKGLPSEFLEINRNLPLVQDTLVLARDRLKDNGSSLDDSSKEAIEPVLSGCETKAKMLQEIFDKVEKGAKEGGSGLDLYRSALLRLGKAHRVETLLQGIIKSLDLLATNHFFRSAIQRGKLVDAEYELSCLKSSVPDSEFEGSGNVQNIAAGATGQQTNISGQGHYISSGSGKQFNAHIMNFISSIKGERPPFDLSILHTSPYLERKNSVADRVPGTCEWFVGHKHFLTWRESTTSSLLWVSANPGCGKTVLSKHLVEHELQTTQTRITCYFFFKEDFEDQRGAKSAISCILHQLFTQREKLLSQKVRKRLDTHATHLASSFDELWEILVIIAQDNANTEFVCVVDALDECEEQDRNALAQALRRFYGSSNNTNLKFLVTGRPLEHVTSIFQDLTASSMPVIHLEGEAPEELEMIAQEIKIYTRHRVRQIKQNLHLDTGEEIMLLRQLQSVQNQTYLWLYLTLRSIEDDLTITKDKIREIASALPRSVNDAYEKMLSQSQDPVNTRKLLHLVVAASRPLTLAEMDFALALRPHHKSYKALGERPPPERLKKHILSLCGHFVTITDSKIYLLHQTAKEFLVTKAEKPSGPRLVWESSLHPQESHDLLSHICMQYLFFTDLTTPSKVNDLDKRGGQAADFIFLDYAFENWAVHTRLADSQDPKVFESLRRLFTTGPGACPTWLGMHWTQTEQIDRPEKLTALMLASAFGLGRFVKHLLEAGRAEVNLKDSLGRTALHYASENGHDGVVRQLLKGPKFRLTELGSWRSAKVDTRDNHGQTPLMAAAKHGNDAVLRRLIDNGANLFMTDSSGTSALGLAAEQEDEKCVRLLLQRSAVNELRGGYGRSALCRAVSSGSEGTTCLLLEAGVDVNAAGQDGDTPLMMACRQGWRSVAVVNILLEAKADIEARDSWGRTALYHAIDCIPKTADEAYLKGQEVIVQMLLMAGAQEDSKDNFGNSPRILQEKRLRKRNPRLFEWANADESKVRRVRFARYRLTTLGYYVAMTTAALVIFSTALFRHRWLALLPSLNEDQLRALRRFIITGVREIVALVFYLVTAGVLFIAMIIFSTRPSMTTARHNLLLPSSYCYPLLYIIGPSALVATLVVYGFYSRTKPREENMMT